MILKSRMILMKLLSQEINKRVNNLHSMIKNNNNNNRLSFMLLKREILFFINLELKNFINLIKINKICNSNIFNNHSNNNNSKDFRLFSMIAMIINLNKKKLKQIII